MSKEKRFVNPVQPECRKCSRFAILKAPCSADACIFREKDSKPDWYKG